MNTKTMKPMKSMSNEAQTKEINNLLGLDRQWYGIDDVFNYLPHKINYGNRIGYLRISKIDIVYSSLELEREGSVALMHQFLTDNLNVFDSFIWMLKFFKEYKDKIEIIEY